MATIVGSTYERAPLVLNLERASGSEQKWVLGSTWCNLGLWPAGEQAARATTFQQACAALAHELGKAAGLSERADKVLDVGVGYGDQTATWVSRFGVRRVLALEPSATHVAAARAAQVKGRIPEAVDLRLGSAEEIDAALGAAGDEPSSFDAVVCLDCAYHFRSRSRFLLAAGRALRPGGRFAAVDLVSGPLAVRPTSGLSALWRSGARRAVAALCSIPPANLHGLDEYDSALDAAGLRRDTIERITPRVLAPFAEHATRQRLRLGASATFAQALFLRLIAALFAFVARHELFEVVVVCATRRE